MSTQQPDMFTSDVWQHFKSEPGAPAGFKYRGGYPQDPDGVEVLLETWEAGTTEPPHYHPGDDMTIMVEGDMAVQFYLQQDGKLVKDGDERLYILGDTAYIRKEQVHSVRYISDCRIVYIHSGQFDFIESKLPIAE
ncbi:hypothetical protein NFHSH190041_31500 [Shewanella sp. NFH-SH190041]|nr:hypothetical protein NFHSH190041_31500 [Shewanella sp. NFH-SH190041]